MKRFPLLPLLLTGLAFAVACSDSTTAPARPHALLVPTGASGDVGKPPPPPVKVVVTVSISSPHIAPFSGVYFSNGNIHDDGIGSTETIGTAWLRFDNRQPRPDAGDASANTRFMVKDGNPPTGMGTLSFGTGVLKETYKIVRVKEFLRYFNCGLPGQPCATITFTAALVGTDCDPDDPEDTDCHDGDATAINSSGCEGPFFVPGDGEPGHWEFVCPDPPPPPGGS